MQKEEESDNIKSDETKSDPSEDTNSTDTDPEVFSFDFVKTFAPNQLFKTLN